MTLLKATALLSRKELNFGRLSAFFSFFSLTGIPVCEASTVFTSAPVPPWKPKKLMRHEQPVGRFNLLSFLLAITQRRNMARVARSTEREVEFWLSAKSLLLFGDITKLLGKVTHGQASLAEKGYLGESLVVLLFASEIRSTYVLQAADRTLQSIDEEMWGNSIFESVGVLGRYILSLSRKRKHLRLWTRHWLRKLYGDTEGIFQLLPAVSFCTVLSSMDLGSTLQFADEDAVDGDAVDGDAVDGDAVDGDAVDGDAVDGDDGNDGDRSEDNGNVADEDVSQKNNFESSSNEHVGEKGSDENDVAPFQLGFAEFVDGLFMATIAEAAVGEGTPGTSDLLETVGNLACKDLADLFSSRPLPSVESVGMRLQRETVLKYSKQAIISRSRNLGKAVGGNHVNPELLLYFYLVATWIGVPLDWGEAYLESIQFR